LTRFKSNTTGKKQTEEDWEAVSEGTHKRIHVNAAKGDVLKLLIKGIKKWGFIIFVFLCYGSNSNLIYWFLLTNHTDINERRFLRIKLPREIAALNQIEMDKVKNQKIQLQFKFHPKYFRIEKLFLVPLCKHLSWSWYQNLHLC